jgi:hypothetical protein
MSMRMSAAAEAFAGLTHVNGAVAVAAILAGSGESP